MIKYMLDDSHLMKKILDISRETPDYVFEGKGATMTRGYIAYIIQISNKIVEAQNRYSYVNDILESIPEWKEFVEEDLNRRTKLQNDPLVNDPRKKVTNNNDDDLDFFFKLKSHESSKKNDDNEVK